MTFTRNTFFAFIPLLFMFQLKAQVPAGDLEQLIDHRSSETKNIRQTADLRQFYSGNQFRFRWLIDKNNENLGILTGFINNAEAFGLNPDDYLPYTIRTNPVKNQGYPGRKDSLASELRYTEAAMHFMHDVAMGNQGEQVSYNGLEYTPSCFNIPAMLNTFLESGRFAVMPQELESKQEEYVSVKTKFNILLRHSGTAGFVDVKVVSAKVSFNNHPLVTRLYQLGIIDSESTYLDDQAMKEKVKAAQDLFGLLTDGVLRSTVIQALNMPLASRVYELKSLLNALRWLYCIKQENHIIVVNIPSATLLVYEHGKSILESRIIVGKKSTPTPTLCSKVSEVVLYPYWNVPYKIATRELLPAIKRNVNYINIHGYQVLNSQGKVMNPYQVNWRGLSASYFPYLIRQSTGCDNALGLIKLNFYNPFSVYLHDTPGKSLFNMNKRFFSHGCMRMEKALEVGHYVLRDNKIAIDTLTQKGCLLNQSPVIVPASEKIPVFVLYHTAWIDQAAIVRFYDDVYNKFRR